MEGILLDTMFELLSLEGVAEVVITKRVVEGTAPPLHVYPDRREDQHLRKRQHPDAFPQSSPLQIFLRGS
jgi:ATP-dependent protease Clp ATPase subunit